METVFRHTPTMTALPFIGAVVVLFLLPGVLRRMSQYWQWSTYTVVSKPLALLVISLFLVVKGMSMAATRVVMTPEGVFEYTGVPWHQSFQGFRLRNVDSVHISHDAKGELWTAIYPQGISVQIRPGSIWAANSQEIRRLLEERGIMFQYDHAGATGDR